MAGLQVVGEALGSGVSYWQQFRNRHGWAKTWLARRSIASARDLWN
jgi:hypothetical protein